MQSSSCPRSWLVLLVGIFTSGLNAEPIVELPLLHDSSEVYVEVHATMDSFVTYLNEYDIRILMEQTSGEILSAEVNFFWNNLNSNNRSRDKEMLEWINAKDYPNGKYELRKLTKIDETNYKAEGNLTLRNTTREIDFPVKLKYESEKITIQGEVYLDTRNYGLPIFRKFMILKVDPVVNIKFNLQGRLTKDHFQSIK